MESGQQIVLGIGVVNEGYDTCRMPGWLDGSVAYHTDGNLYDADTCDHGTETKGISFHIISYSQPISLRFVQV